MKKYLIVVLFFGLFLSGCSKNEYNDFEHYDLKDYDISRKYVYTDDDSVLHEYVITDITLEESIEIVNALFYKVAEDDYILLDENRFCDNLILIKILNTLIFTIISFMLLDVLVVFC